MDKTSSSSPIFRLGLLVVLVVNLQSTYSGVLPQAPFIKKTDCGNLCSLAFCVAQKPEQCNPKTQVFVPRDGDCYCCDLCINTVADQKCASNHCDTVKCRDVPSKECFDKGMAFAPKDECTCCDTCV